MFEILMFLFENYMEGKVTLNADNKTVLLELEKAGFDRFEIERALNWIDGLNEIQHFDQLHLINPLSIRHYLPEEKERLSPEGQGFILYLEQLNILDAPTREIVIDRIMALDPTEVNMGRIRWVILMALFNQPEKRAALLLLQDMILANAFDMLH